MKKLFLIILILTTPLVYAGFFTSLKNKMEGKSPEPTLSQSQKIFDKFCTKETTNYGTKITCQQKAIQYNAKIDASNTVKCSQKYQGISDKYPAPVKLNRKLLESLNKCNGTISGPHILATFDNKESNGNYVQNNKLIAVYDIVCNDKKYESGIYTKQQADYEANLDKEYNSCINPSLTDNILMSLVYMISTIAAAIIITMIVLFSYKLFKSRK